MSSDKILTSVVVVFSLLSLLACKNNSVVSEDVSSSSEIRNSSSSDEFKSSSSSVVVSSSSIDLSSSSLDYVSYREINITEPTNIFDIRYLYQDTITGECLGTAECFGPYNIAFNIDSILVFDDLLSKSDYVVEANFIFEGLPVQSANTTNYLGTRIHTMFDRLEIKVTTEIDTVKVIYDKPNSYKFKIIVFEDDNIVAQNLNIEEDESLVPMFNPFIYYKYLAKVKASANAYYYIAYVSFESSPQFDEINREPVSEACKESVAENCVGISFLECYKTYVCDPHIFEDRMF